MLIIERFEKFNKFSDIMAKIFNSNFYLAGLAIMAVCGFIFKAEFEIMQVLAVVLFINLVSCREQQSSIVTFALLCMVPLGFYGASFTDFLSIAWILPLVSIGFFAHLIMFPATYKIGKMFYCILAYSLALIFGGVGVISFQNYFKLTPLFYIFGLGFMLLAIYVYMDAYLPVKKNLAEYYARSMAFVGLACTLIWLLTYLLKIPEFVNNGFYLPYAQWKNNLGNYILLSMPFAFYLSTKRKFGWVYFLMGIAEYAAMMFSQCRGGMIAATILFPVLIILSFIYAPKKNYKYFIIILAVAIAATLTFFFLNFEYMLEKIRTYIAQQGSGREKLYEEALKNFREHPFVGVGIGYRNEIIYPLKNMSIFWYHSTILQVIASMGLMGLAAYTYQMLVRLKIILKKNAFNLFLFVAFVGFEGYSMINTGDFSPLPFVPLLTIMLIICDKHNQYTAQERNEQAIIAEAEHFSIIVKGTPETNVCAEKTQQSTEKVISTCVAENVKKPARKRVKTSSPKTDF